MITETFETMARLVLMISVYYGLCLNVISKLKWKVDVLEDAAMFECIKAYCVLNNEEFDMNS